MNPIIDTTNSLNISEIFQKVHDATAAIESNLSKKVGEMSANGETLSSAQMLDLQHDMNVWSLATNMESNIMKTISDGIKNTIGNLR